MINVVSQVETEIQYAVTSQIKTKYGFDSTTDNNINILQQRVCINQLLWDQLERVCKLQ
jgi:hypothetical protein